VKNTVSVGIRQEARQKPPPAVLQRTQKRPMDQLEKLSTKAVDNSVDECAAADACTAENRINVSLVKK
jgi:hypothetical protein